MDSGRHKDVRCEPDSVPRLAGGQVVRDWREVQIQDVNLQNEKEEASR